MKLKTLLFGKTYAFRDVKDVLAKANEEKSGDRLAGHGRRERRRSGWPPRWCWPSCCWRDLRENPAVPYEEDEVTRIIQDDVNEKHLRGDPELDGLRAARVAAGRDARRRADHPPRVSRGLTCEMIAAVCKLMSNLDLIYAAKKMPVTAHCNTTIGLPGTLSCRLQPNHTTDDPDGIMASLLEGLHLRRGRRGAWA